jgi:hypothetical protein
VSPIEENVTELLAELAAVTPVEDRPFPARGRVEPLVGPAGRDDRPDYPVESIDGLAGRSRRNRVLVGVAAVLVMAIVGGLVALGRSGGSPMSVSAADLPVDTAALGAGRMAVVIENDLYVADGPTGQVWRLTDTGRGEEVSNVSFSHDGEWVAFTIHDENGLWVSRWDGSEHHRIGRAPSTYAWSPTDDRLAYTTQDQLWVAGPGQDLRTVSTGGLAAPAGFTPVLWSPDGTTIGFQGIDGHPQFVTIVGGATDTNADADWLIAWPRETVTLVDVGVDGFERRNLAADVREGSQVVTRLADLSSPQYLQTSSANEARVVAISSTPGLVTSCDLNTLVCEPVDAPFAPQGYSDPALSTDGSMVALVGGFDETDVEGTTLVVSDLESGGHRMLGRVDTVSRGNVELGAALFGTGTESPLWINDSGLLVRVDGSAVVRIDVRDGTRTTVVTGDRFLPPADDYPGGTGLAYWSPTSG